MSFALSLAMGHEAVAPPVRYGQLNEGCFRDLREGGPAGRLVVVKQEPVQDHPKGPVGSAVPQKG